MKKLCLFLLAAALLLICTASCALAENIPIDAAHFPDANFRSYVASNIDTDKNGVLSDGERNKVTEINVMNKKISSLQGIKLFPALSVLYCSSNILRTLDMSGCTAMRELSCFLNQLTSLNVSGCTALTNLHFEGNQLTRLDVSQCYDLEVLNQCH